VEHGDVLASTEPEGPFHLIFLHHVFEHLPRQEAALGWMADRLHLRGRIVIVVPNPEAVAAWRHGRRWIGWDPPRHLCLLSLRGFGEMASRIGLRVTCTSRFRQAAVHDLMSRSSREEAPDRRPDLPARLRVLSNIFTALFRPLSRPGGDELHLVLTHPSPEARSRG
jgi:protein-L-isoaspartate O-methyltransferase